MAGEKRCDDCAKVLVDHDTISLDAETSRNLCSQCFNETIAADAGLDFSISAVGGSTFEQNELVTRTFSMEQDSTLVHSARYCAFPPRHT